MAISTYTELKAALADWLLRDDLTAVIPTFISLAEADIARNMRHWLQERKVTTTLDEPFEFLPDDWLATIALRHVDGQEIKQVGVTEMAALSQRGATGKPVYFRYEAGRIEVYPKPDTDYEVELVYYGRVPALSDIAATNWLLTNHPDILLYGSLLQSAPYLSDDAKAATWGNLYANALRSIQADSDKARHSGPLRMRIKI